MIHQMLVYLNGLTEGYQPLDGGQSLSRQTDRSKRWIAAMLDVGQLALYRQGRWWRHENHVSILCTFIQELLEGGWLGGALGSIRRFLMTRNDCCCCQL